MNEPIVSIKSIEAQARAAAAIYANVNDACPYSFYTAAGRAFREAFHVAREAINKTTTQTDKSFFPQQTGVFK